LVVVGVVWSVQLVVQQVALVVEEEEMVEVQGVLEQLLKDLLVEQQLQDPGEEPLEAAVLVLLGVQDKELGFRLEKRVAMEDLEFCLQLREFHCFMLLVEVVAQKALEDLELEALV
jgi:hypothetical protein